jgi:hypothetical protein
MFAISCHALFLPPEVIDEENFAFKITFLFSDSSNNTTFSLSAHFGFRQEIANIVNAGNSVKRDIKEIQKKNGTIYVLPQKLRFLYIVGAKDKQVIDNLYIKKNI